MDFIRSADPASAKAQVEQIVRERGMTMQDLEQVKSKAVELGKLFGLKF